MTTIAILGGTGDLSRKKLIPSLYNLYRKGQLEDFRIVGTSRHEMTDSEFRELFGEHIKNKEKWDDFTKHIRFIQLDFYDDDSFRNFGEQLEDGNRLFYLATLPQHFEQITRSLAKHGLVDDASKVLYEKPFGDNLHSARQLNEQIHESFPEDRVYRIDHYLDKELIENITVLRFTNTAMIPLNGELVDHIQIVMSEDFGVDGRGEFYDKYGALKDVFQNHLLQLLALVTMDEPERFDSECIRDEKVKLLKSLKVEDVMTGQYDGYLDEEGVVEGSQTETFACMKFLIGNDTWKNTPVYMTSGKNLEKDTVKVYVEFRNTPCKLFEGVCNLNPNNLVVEIKPNEVIYLTLNTKVPGEMTTTTSRMEFCYSCQHGPNTPEAYENLLREAIKGNQKSFVRSDEIEAQWDLIDNLEKPEPFTYPKGSFPKQAQEWIAKDGKSWFI